MVRVTQRQNDTQYGHRKQERDVDFMIIFKFSHVHKCNIRKVVGPITVISVRSSL